jgi:hypothetical protein
VSAPPSELQLVDVTESRAGEILEVSGSVANNTQKAITRVRIKAVFMDAEGRTVSSSEQAIAGGAVLSAGEKASFKIKSPPSLDIVRYRLSVSGDQVVQD